TCLEGCSRNLLNLLRGASGVGRFPRSLGASFETPRTWRSGVPQDEVARGKTAFQALTSDRDLGADLDDPAGRDLEEVGRVAGALGEADAELVLPEGHAGMGGRADRAPRQEERGRHDVELEALPAQDREAAR